MRSVCPRDGLTLYTRRSELKLISCSKWPHPIRCFDGIINLPHFCGEVGSIIRRRKLHASDVPTTVRFGNTFEIEMHCLSDSVHRFEITKTVQVLQVIQARGVPRIRQYHPDPRIYAETDNAARSASMYQYIVFRYRDFRGGLLRRIDDD